MTLDEIRARLLLMGFDITEDSDLIFRAITEAADPHTPWEFYFKIEFASGVPEYRVDSPATAGGLKWAYVGHDFERAWKTLTLTWSERHDRG